MIMIIKKRRFPPNGMFLQKQIMLNLGKLSFEYQIIIQDIISIVLTLFIVIFISKIYQNL